MTKTVEEVRHELFEASGIKSASSVWHEGCYQYKTIDDEGEEYFTAGLGLDDLKWQGFNAALDAVEIQLPLSRKIIDEGGWLNDVLDADEVRAAIEQTGLGLRIK